MTTVAAPADAVAKLSDTLTDGHAPHLLPGVLACLAGCLRPPSEQGGRRVVDAVAVVGLARILNGAGRPELIGRVLLATTPWLPVAEAIPAARPAPPAGVGLTVRQVEILHLASYGLTNGEIGQRLYLSEDTIKTHVRRARQALGARDRTHAVRLCLERGVFDLDT